MVNLFEIGVNIVEETTALVFMTLYLGSKYKGMKKIISLILSITISVSVITYLNTLYIYEGVLGLAFTGIFFLYAMIFLKGDVYVKLFISGFTNCVMYFIAIICSLGVSIVFAEHSSQLYGMTVERIALIVSSKGLLIVACVILLKYKFNYVAKKRNMIALIIMPIVSELSMVGIMEVFLQYSNLKNELFLAMIGVMIANILTYYVFIKINKDVERETEIRVMQQRYESDKKYAREVEELYSKTCSIRHDLTKHFDTILGLLSSNEGKAIEYIQAVTKNNIDEIKSLVKTDNVCFDAIANAKIAVCERLGIKCEIRIMNHSLASLEQDEIGILFGNLFDNAIEASKNTKERKISLDICKQDDRCSIIMLNSIDKSVLKNNNELNTTKEDKEFHGFGTKNIQKIVKKYDGMIDYFEENGYFGCDIII